MTIFAVGGLVILAAAEKIATASLSIPGWLPQFVMVVLGGGWVGVWTWRSQKRIQEASADEAYERLYARTVANLEVVEAKYETTRADLRATRSELSEVRANRDRVVAELRGEIRALEEQLATTRAEFGLDERRKP